MEKENVPQLRFPEFESEWAKKRLSKLTLKISDGIHTTPKYDETGEYYFVNGNNLKDGQITINESTKRVNVSEYQKHKKDLTESTILMSINGTIGNLAFYKGEEVVLGKSAAYLIVNDKTDEKFIYNFLQIGSTLRFFESELTGSTIKNLSLRTIKETPVWIPKLIEQQKIASFLSSVDKKIEQLTRKKELLEEYKKGVMQKLFPKPGEQHPKLRFKDENGEDFPDWEVKRLGELITPFTEKSTENNQYEVLTSSNEGLVKQTDYYGDNRLTSRDSTGFNIVPPKHITFRNRSDNRNFTFNENNLGFTGLVSTYYPVFYLPKGTNRFFLALTEVLKNQIGRYSVGTSQTVLSFNTLKSIRCFLPCIEEQIRVSKFLAIIDLEIAHKEKRVLNFRLFKKGLLQQMFV
ncbi:hypothetical protein GYB29_11440 [bacterium]|nr:hypothetical protein [bacterium]